MASNCTLGIQNLVKTTLNNKPWFEYDQSLGIVNILDSFAKKINKENSHGVAKTTAITINKQINDGYKNIGDIAFVKSNKEGRGYIDIAPTINQIYLINAQNEKEINELQQQLDEEELLKGFYQTRETGNYDVVDGEIVVSTNNGFNNEYSLNNFQEEQKELDKIVTKINNESRQLDLFESFQNIITNENKPTPIDTTKSDGLLWGKMSSYESETNFQPTESKSQYGSDNSLQEKINGRSFKEIWNSNEFTQLERENILLHSIQERMLDKNTFNGELFAGINSKLGKLELRVVDGLEAQITPQQKQQAQQLYSQYLEQNPNGSVEQFKSWVNNRNDLYYQVKNIFNAVKELEDKLKSLNKTANSIGSEKNIDDILKKAGLESDFRKEFLQLLKDNPSLKSLKLSEVISSYLKEFVKESDRQYYTAIEEPLSEELENVLIDYFDKFHIRRKQLDNLKEKFGVDSIGIFDVLAKTIYYSKNRNLLTLPEEYGHVFVELLGSISNKKADNPLFKYLFDNIESWDGYQRVFRDYKNLYVTAEGNIDIYKIKKEAIGQAIGIALVRNYKVQKGDKGFWSKIQEVIDYILNLIKGIDYVSLNTTVDNIAKDILSKNYSKLDRLKKDTSNYNLLSYSETIKNQNKKDGGKALKFMQWFSKKEMIITGSLAYRLQGNVYRPEIDALHDIDNIVPSDVHKLNLNKSNFLNEEQLEKDRIYRKLISEGNYKEAKSYKIQGNLKLDLEEVVKQIDVLQDFKKEFPDTDFLYSFFNQKANAYYVTINAIWSENQELKDRFKSYSGSFNNRLANFTEEELSQLYLFDFFLRPETSEHYKKIEDKEFGLSLAHFNYSFYEKLNMMGRAKDAYDYQMWNYFDENNILAPDFNDRLVYFQINQSQQKQNQIQEVFNEYPELSKIGTVEQYASYLDTIFPDSKVIEMDNSLYISVLNQLEQENKIEKDCSGKLKAEKGLQTNFTKNGEWKIIKDLKGYPTHKEGGVDLTIGKNGVSIKNGNTQFTAQHGLVIPKDGTIVSELYKQKTGKDWNTAKQEGLTTGTYEDNMKLRQRLLSGEFDNKQSPITKQNNNVQNTQLNQNQDYIKAKDFNEAFKIARQQLGANQIFEYQGRKYGTNLKGEKFEPSEEVLTRFNMNKPEVKERLQQQNKMTTSIYSDKQTTKLEPEYQNWSKVKQRKQEINKMNQSDIIKEYHKNSNEEYLIVDKKEGKMHLMKGDKEIASYNVGTGANVGDEQTKTVIKNGKVMWDEGNKMTGAGIYEVSGVNPKNPHYSNAPTWNFKNEQGIEVPMAIHSSFGNRTAKIKDNDETNNRLSNGCINGICYDLEDLYKKGYKQGQKLYVLPDDENNKYELKNGKLVFSSKNPDVNKTVKTLNYKPIKLEIDEKTFKDKVFTAFDLNDEKEFETTKSYVKALQDNKQKIMKAAQIDGDTYNDIAKIAFGIYGTESNFGDTHSTLGNLSRAVNKYLDPKSSSSPDVKSKYSTYGADDNNNSVGYTQIRWSQLNERELKVLKELNITSNKDFLQPDKSAIATAAILAIRYQEQLTPEQKKDIETYLPTKWNNRGNYSSRVKTNSQYLKIKELN